MKTISDTSLFHDMLAAERSIVFVQARWSGYAMRTLGLLGVFEQQLNAHSLQFAHEFTLWEIDLSDQEGAIWEATKKWLEPQLDSTNQLMWGGWGSMIWCSHGNVLNSAIRVEQLINVIELTRATFD